MNLFLVNLTRPAAQNIWLPVCHSFFSINKLIVFLFKSYTIQKIHFITNYTWDRNQYLKVIVYEIFIVIFQDVNHVGWKYKGINARNMAILGKKKVSKLGDSVWEDIIIACLNSIYRKQRKKK